MVSIVPLVSIGPVGGSYTGLAMSFMSGTMAEALNVRSMGLAAVLCPATATLPDAKSSKSGLIFRNYDNH